MQARFYKARLALSVGVAAEVAADEVCSRLLRVLKYLKCVSPIGEDMYEKVPSHWLDFFFFFFFFPFYYTTRCRCTVRLVSGPRTPSPSPLPSPFAFRFLGCKWYFSLSLSLSLYTHTRALPLETGQRSSGIFRG
jgi:hypothetical protein